VGVYESDTAALRAVMVMVYTYGSSCDMHIASDGSRQWATRNILAGLFGYVFILHGAPQATITVEPDNTAALIMNIKLGFQVQARVPGLMADGGDAVLLTMRAHECPWIKDKEQAHE